MEVKNIFMTYSHNISDSERVPVIMEWLGGEGLHIIQTLTDKEQWTCNNIANLFNILNVKIKLHHNETILSLQYCTLSSNENDGAEERMVI